MTLDENGAHGVSFQTLALLCVPFIRLPLQPQPLRSLPNAAAPGTARDRITGHLGAYSVDRRNGPVERISRTHPAEAALR